MSSKPMKNRTRAFVAGFSTGLAQAVSNTGGGSYHRFPAVGRSAAEAFRGDWSKLGSDMKKATSKVLDGAKR